MSNIPFAYSIHPGGILLTEFMQPLGLTAYRLAKDIHVSVPQVNDLVRGKRGSLRIRGYGLRLTLAVLLSSGWACRLIMTYGSRLKVRRFGRLSPAPWQRRTQVKAHHAR
jgi:addiction module HigA family antidote